MKKIIFGDHFHKPQDLEELKGKQPLKWIEDIKGKKILEAGCGSGLYVHFFSKRNNVVGLEFNPEFVEKARENLRKWKIKARIIQGDVRKIPFKKESFDFVFCNGVIEHFPETEKAIREIYRVLKPSGKALISVPCRISFFVPIKILQQIIDKIFKTNFWTCGYEKSFTPWQFKRMLRENSFKIKKFEICEIAEGRRFPIVSKIIKILDKPFFWLGIGGRFMYALCEKI